MLYSFDRARSSRISDFEIINVFPRKEQNLWSTEEEAQDLEQWKSDRELRFKQMLDSTIVRLVKSFMQLGREIKKKGRDEIYNEL